MLRERRCREQLPRELCKDRFCVSENFNPWKTKGLCGNGAGLANFSQYLLGHREGCWGAWLSRPACACCRRTLKQRQELEALVPARGPGPLLCPADAAVPCAR